MAQQSWDAVWIRLRAGQHTVVMSHGPLPPVPQDLEVLHVPCDDAVAQGSVLDTLQKRLESILGEPLSAMAQGQAPLEMGLRHRFLDAMPGQPLDAMLVEACNRLADQFPGQRVLLFETLEAADAATLATLAQMLQRPGWLRLPLLITLRQTPQGRVAELVYLVCRDESAAALFEIAGEVPHCEEAVPFDWQQLPPAVLRVVRAGTVLGTSFEAALVARLLEMPIGTVLEHLQDAVDAGAPLADRGEGTFTLPAEAVRALQSQMLPSLLTFWHSRLGELLSQAPSAPRAPVPRTPVVPLDDTLTRPPRHDYGDLFTPAAPAEADAPVPSTTPAVAAPAVPPRPAERTATPPTHQSRAAAHWQAAGHTEAAIEQYLAAVREAVARGDTHRAYSLLASAMPLLDTLPASSRQAVLRAQIWLERGRLQWHGMLAGAPFTLQDALVSLETAYAALPPDAPLALRSACATVSAGICYDLGDQGTLRRALAVLAESSQRMLQADEPLLAVRLCNDQAAIYIRLGDPMQATRLLTQARELCARMLHHNPQAPVVLEELAATDHLLARLPLHLPRRPGRETEATAAGLEHAQAAERTYRHLNQHYELARVWETMGRLALQSGAWPEAKERLTTAHALQRQLGDATGLARSTAALADLCGQAGMWDDALALLTESIHLNVSKGSPIGLAFNRQALMALAQAAPLAANGDATRWRTALADLAQRLEQAEAVCGRMTLPGGAGERV